ncbi:hypothetical protein P4C99_19920 [Pontiellaceae bacterium B1224]|nr:hypothetical protein [Pontiellaceae bacterium B1224]
MLRQILDQYSGCNKTAESYDRDEHDKFHLFLPSINYCRIHPNGSHMEHNAKPLNRLYHYNIYGLRILLKPMQQPSNKTWRSPKAGLMKRTFSVMKSSKMVTFI